jgi:formylglycine-generating enzyme required for sulfatase activity
MLWFTLACGDVPRAEVPKELTLDLGNGIHLQGILIPAGTFQMGFQAKDLKHYPSEIPGREVTLSGPFYMGKYPVTQAQWQALMPGDPSRFSGPGHPVDGVSWKDAQAFCRKLAEKTSRPVRLPTDAEWEYACRAGSRTTFYFGNDPNLLPRHAWHEDNSNDTTHPVGQKKPNAWGLYDMCGNVWEWCSDWYERIDDAAPPAIDPQGPAKSPQGAHVLRGGAWHTRPGYCRSIVRGGNFPCGEGGPASWDNASRSGFRIVIAASLEE